MEHSLWLPQYSCRSRKNLLYAKRRHKEKKLPVVILHKVRMVREKGSTKGDPGRNLQKPWGVEAMKACIGFGNPRGKSLEQEVRC